MSPYFRPLLAKPVADTAAESHDAPTTDPPAPGPASAAAARGEPRQCVGAACDTCRLKKTKCDAARPVCSTCRKRGWMCYYATMPGETRNKSLKREVGKLRAVSEELGRLFDYLRLANRPEADAALDQIRNGLSPHEVLLAMGAPPPPPDPLVQLAGGGAGPWGFPLPFTRGGSLDDTAAPALAAAHERYVALRPAASQRGYTDPTGASQHAQAATAPWPIPTPTPTAQSTPGAEMAHWPGFLDPPPATAAGGFPMSTLRHSLAGPGADDAGMPASL